MRTNLRQIAEAAAHDPAKALRDAAGNLDEIEVFHNLVLAATYIAPPRMMKGPNGEDVPFYSTDRALAEDRFQGKAYLVLQVGPTAFQDAAGVAFGGKNVAPGDWIIARPSDGFELFKGDSGAKEGASVRLFEDVHIKGRISDPTVIY
jgi:hypothetical protein